MKDALKLRLKEFADYYGYTFCDSLKGKTIYKANCVGVGGIGYVDDDFRDYLQTKGVNDTTIRLIMNQSKTEELGQGYVLYFPGHN